MSDNEKEFFISGEVVESNDPLPLNKNKIKDENEINPEEQTSNKEE